MSKTYLPRPRPYLYDTSVALQSTSRAAEQAVDLCAADQPRRGPVHFVMEWAASRARLPWFPWFLFAIGVMDPFTLCGFLLTPLLTLALAASRVQRAAMLCVAASSGCLVGNVAFSILLDRMGSIRAADSPQLAAAKSLLQRHGAIAGASDACWYVSDKHFTRNVRIFGARRSHEYASSAANNPVDFGGTCRTC